MRRRRLLLATMLTFVGALALGGSPAPGNAARPAGGLSLTFHPYAGEGHKDMPAEVLKFVVVDGGSRGMWVREWPLKNRSDKGIIKIRRALFVYSESDPETLLLRHRLEPYVWISLAPGQEWPLGKCSGNFCPHAFAMLSAGELLRPLAGGGEPEGDYRIALGIDKVWFADGTSWELEAARPE